jgi:type II secretory pathway pseudopilin PulG
VTLGDAAIIAQAIAIVGLAAAVVVLSLYLLRTSRELGVQLAAAANARADQEHARADVAGRQTAAAQAAESDATDTLAAIHAQAAKSGGRLDAGDLYDAGVHQDSRDQNDGVGAGAVPDSRSAPTPPQGTATARRLPRPPRG